MIGRHYFQAQLDPVIGVIQGNLFSDGGYFDIFTRPAVRGVVFVGGPIDISMLRITGLISRVRIMVAAIDAVTPEANGDEDEDTDNTDRYIEDPLSCWRLLDFFP